MERQTLRVLLIEDDSDHAELVRTWLAQLASSSLRLDCVGNYDEGLKALLRQEHDVCLLDYRLRGRNGLQLLKAAVAEGCRVPVIVLTSQGNRNIDLLAVKSGAADYLDKSLLNAELLERSIRYAIATRRLEGETSRLAAVERFAGGIAHDFNNILTIINGYCDLLSEDCSSEMRTEGLQVIKEVGLRAASLTQQLLTFSRKQIGPPEIIDLNALVADLEKMLRRMIGAEVEWTTVLDPSIGQIKADPGQIQQVLMNLAVHARAAMPRGGKLTVETRPFLQEELPSGDPLDIAPGNYAMLSIRDTGHGMDQETRQRVNESFFTTRGDGEGTGLGLSTVFGIVKQSGGYIKLHSKFNAGTTFKIFFPVLKTPIRNTQGKPRREVHLGDETILLVEDENVVRRLAARILGDCGYLVLEASDGRSAVQAAREYEGPIRLLVTDLVLPGMSGPEVAQQLTGVRPGLQVIYMSGCTDDALVRHGVLETEVAFIQKPFSPTELARKVREVLDEADGPPQLDRERILGYERRYPV